MRFAARESAIFSQPEAATGVAPGAGGIQHLTRLMGRARALEVMLSAGDYDAELAERYGWINRALPANALNDFVRSLATRGGCSCVDGPRLAREGDTLGAINLGQRGYRRVGHSHLQGARKRQADHDDGARQHADRDQSAFAVASHNKRAHPLVERRAPPTKEQSIRSAGWAQASMHQPAPHF